jgi:hypothetical protein
MKHERCIRCGEFVWIEDDVPHVGRRNGIAAPVRNVRESAGYDRNHHNHSQKEKTDNWTNSRREMQLEAA